MFDLIIKKGMAVLPDAVEMVDIAVKNGVIAAMAPTIDERAAREINALGQYVLPGVVDVHMHLSEPGRTEWEAIVPVHRQWLPAELLHLQKCR